MMKKEIDMIDDLYIKQHKKTVISTNKCSCSIEIGDCAIDQGFLLQFPGATLAIFLYLITHANERHMIETNPTIISSYLPNSYNLETITEGLKYLENHDIIEFSYKRDGDYTYQIRIIPDNIGRNLDHHEKLNTSNTYHTENNREQDTKSAIFNDMRPSDREDKPECLYYDQRELRSDLISKANPSRSDLFQAILTFIPPEENITLLETTINQWLEDFDCELIKELIRRVNKWLVKYNNPPNRAFRYLNGIIDDWYKKEITSYKDLQYFDQLFRETRDLAKMYGLNEWHNVKPIHMETFNRWLNEDFPLSTAVVKFAIKEAVRRKKDGQPSLKYIEDNFIKPWKKGKVRDCEQAMSILRKSDYKRKTRRTSSRSSSTGSSPNGKRNTNKNQGSWDDFSWDFE